ncbi:MAG: hypothetical protein WKF75_17595 [Singulisphaera sp.]
MEARPGRSSAGLTETLVASAAGDHDLMRDINDGMECSGWPGAG